jgi:hypothetical protein
MARKYLTSIDLVKNELQNARIQNLATDPSSPVTGQVYYNTAANEIRVYNGTIFEAVGLNGVTADAAELNILDGALLTTTELNYVDGVTSGIQGQLDLKAPLANPTFTGTVTLDTGVNIVFEGTTPDAFETTLTAGDPTADRTITLPNATTTLVGRDTTDTLTNKTITSPLVSGLALTDSSIVFEGSVDDANETTLTVTNPTVDRTITLPDLSGTVILTTNKVTDLTAPTSSFSMNSQTITSLATPVNATDAANKQYVDDVAQGLNIHAASWAATTTALTATYANGTAGVGATLTNSGAQAAFVVDGVTPTVGQRILVKNQATAAQNGIYTVTNTGSVSTNWVLTRATDFDSAVEIAGGDFTFVDTGTTLANTGWVNGTEVTTVGTDPVDFVQFSGAGTYTASNGVLLTGTNFTFAPSTTGGLQTAAGGASIKLATNSGAATDANGFAIGAGNGITVGTNTISVDATVVARKFSQTLSTSATSYTITHNLGTLDVHVQVYTVADGSEVIVDNLRATTNTVTLAFNTAPTANAYRVVVIG